MALRIDWARWGWPALLGALALPVGVLAGVRPELTLLVALGLAFVLVVFADLTTGLVAFTFLTFFELLPSADSAAFGFTKLAGLLLALSWLARLAVHPDAKSDLLRAHPMIGGLLVLLIAWAGVSVIWAENTAGAIEATYRLGLNAVLFLIVYTAVRVPRDAVRVLWAFVIGASAATAYGIVTGDAASPYGEAARLSGTAENANELASTLVASLALALGLAFHSRDSPAQRAAALAMATIALYGVLLTVSRSGLIALGVAALAAIVLSGRWRPRVAVLAIGVAVSALAYFALFAPDAARERVRDFEGGTGREDIWRVAWRMVEDQPLQGVGAGNFSDSSIHYLLVPGTLRRSDFIVDSRKNAHNVYLGTLAELGIVGLALLAALIVAIIACALWAIDGFRRVGDIRMEMLARAQLVAVFGLLASLFFASDEYKKQLWLLLALAPALLAIARAELDRARERSADAEPG
ncbi:MAG: O-antigen ligase family protein [Actinobacteria bacterium]|nr:O-antigen ligase family protein [Actinomycetota bacterium]